MKLYIKYMVSLRCKLLVKEELRKLGIDKTVIGLGMVELPEDMTADQVKQLGENLLISGLQLLDDKKTVLIEKIKRIVIDMVHYTDELPGEPYSTYISSKMNYKYNYLSNLFSEVKGITIQQFIILHKIEKIKELILYDELSLSEIACKLQYSSVGHLSSQFKKITGHTPSFYKKVQKIRAFNLENL